MATDNKRISSIKRAQKESLLSKKIAILLNQIAQDDANIAELMLNRVELSTDKGVATLYFYLPGGQEAFNKKVKALILYKPSLRSAIAKLVPSRYTPELVFRYDNTFEKELKINQLLDKIKHDDDNQDAIQNIVSDTEEEQ